VAEVAARRGLEVFFAGGAFASPASRRGVRGTPLGDDLIEACSTIRRVTLARSPAA
jgi:hypothetical protein